MPRSQKQLRPTGRVPEYRIVARPRMASDCDDLTGERTFGNKKMMKQSHFPITKRMIIDYGEFCEPANIPREHKAPGLQN